MIKVNKDWQDNGREVPPEIRMRIELLVRALEDIEPELLRLRLDSCASVSLNQLAKLIDVKNKARHYLQVIEAWTQESEFPPEEE
jgi:hypothetical protein